MPSVSTCFKATYPCLWTNIETISGISSDSRVIESNVTIASGIIKNNVYILRHNLEINLKTCNKSMVSLLACFFWFGSYKYSFKFVIV